MKLTGKEVDKIDTISKEVNSIVKEMETQATLLHDLMEALQSLEKDFETNKARLEALQTATEKEVLRLESLTINEEPVLEDEEPKDLSKDIKEELLDQDSEKPAKDIEQNPTTEKTKDKKVDDAQMSLLDNEQ